MKTNALTKDKPKASRNVLLGGALIVTTLVVYIPAMRAGFIWDDVNYITETPRLPTARIIHATDGLYRIWFTGETADYWPVTDTMFWLEWRLWGMNPQGYHVVNILLHALCAVLLWRVLKHMDLPGAWLAAMIFAVHPVCTASVAWISERKNTLSMVFYLLTILAYLRFDRSRKWGWYVATLLCFALALLSKTSVVMLPVVLLGLAWWKRRKMSARDLLPIAPLFVMSLVMAMATIWFQQHHAIGSESIVRPEGFFSRLAAVGWIVWFYLYKALVPLKLSMIYSRWNVEPADILAWIPLAGLVVAFICLWFARRWLGRGVLFALGYFVATLFPVLGFFDMFFMRYSLVADHFQYLSIIAVLALVGWVIAKIYSAKRRSVRLLGRVVAATLIVVLAVLTWRTASVYKGPESLWRDTIAKNEQSWAAPYNLGVFYSEIGKLDQAVEYYHRAIQLRPDEPEAHNNLTMAYIQMGELDLAFIQVRAAMELIPNHPYPYFHLGNIHMKKGELEQAAKAYRRAVQLAPGHTDSHFNLGVVYGKLRHPDDAGQEYRTVIRLSSDHFAAHNNLGLIYARKGELDSAIEHFLAAIRIKGDYARAHKNLARVYEVKGDPTKAAQHRRAAIRIDPGDADIQSKVQKNGKDEESSPKKE